MLTLPSFGTCALAFVRRAYYVFRNAIFVYESKSAEIFQGIVAWVAAVIITILAFAMLRFLGWEAKWQRRLDAVAKQVSHQQLLTHVLCF